MTISEWADRYRYVSRSASAEPGRWRTSRLPYQREPMDSLCDPDVLETVLMWAKQVGKTEIFLNTLGFYADQDPAPALVVYPTIDSAKSFMKEKFSAMVRDTPRLRDKIREPRSKGTESTTMNRFYAGGSLTACGANSAASLRQRSRRVILQDEVDSYQANSEGDPSEQADGRAESFFNAVFGKSSTPTIKGFSKVEAAFEQTDKRYWHVDCPLCKQQQTLKWKQARWPDGEPEKAVYLCEHCSGEWTDAQRINAVKTGRWKATAPFTGRRGYHLSGLYGILGKKRAFKTYLHQFVANFLKAKRKGREAMVVWINTFLAETYQDDGERVNTNELLNRGEDYSPTSIPTGVLLITAGADVQADRIEVLVDGWGFGEERWFIQYKVIPGNTLTDAPWNELDEFLKTTYLRTDGLMFPITSACVDCGFSADQVLKWTKPRFVRRIYAVRGDNQRGVPIISKKSTRNRYNAPVFFIGTDVAKAMIHGRLKLTSGPNMIHWPNDEVLGFNINFFDMLTAEEQVVRYVKGFARLDWVKIRDRNEALDCSVYSLAALNQLQPNWKSLLKLTQDRLRKLREEGKVPPIKPSEDTDQAPPASPPAAPQPAVKKEEATKDHRKVRMKPKKKGFVNWSRW